MLARLPGIDAVVLAISCLYLTLLLTITYLGQADGALGHRHHDFDHVHSLLNGNRLSLEPLARSRRAATSTTTSTSTSTTTTTTTTTTTRRPDNSTLQPSVVERATWWQKYLAQNATIDHWLVDRVFELTPGYYPAGDVAFFLDGHEALKLHDPRAYFTEERISRSLAILLHELPQVPGRLRFAFVVRIFYELGRKIASKLSTYHRDMLSLLSKKSDDLGTKPEVSSYLDVMARAFESKEDCVHPMGSEATAREQKFSRVGPTWIQNNQSDLPSSSMQTGKVISTERDTNLDSMIVRQSNQFDNNNLVDSIAHDPIKALLEADPVKHKVWNASLDEIAIRFANSMRYFVANATSANLLPKGREKRVFKVLSLALMDGARVMLLSFQTSTRQVYANPREAIEFLGRILTKCLVIFTKHNVENLHDQPGKLVRAQYEALQTNSYRDLNPLGQDLTDLPRAYLMGPWGARIYEHLGSSERVIKLFASLVSRVPLGRRSRYVRFNLPRVKVEFARTMGGFISLMSSQFNKHNSGSSYLLDDTDGLSRHHQSKDTLASRQLAADSLKVRESYQTDKDRVPARCYLSGRRWRLYLRKALKGYTQLDDLIQEFVDQINSLKESTLGQASSASASGGGSSGSSAPSSSHDLERLCLPRLEMGLKGLGINGEPPGEADAMRNKFPLRNPIEGLNKDEDPFTSGARMGYRFGFMIGYNRHRNASLELENQLPGSASAQSYREPQKQPTRPVAELGVSSEKARQIASQTASYLSKTAYWSGMLVGARRTVEIATREGYMATLKVSLRAGMLLPLEAGSRLAAIKCSSFASQVGGQAGREHVNEYLMGRDSLDEQTRRQLLELGETYGSLAGQSIGESLGAIVGREAALEAYRRTVSRGGKVVSAKFHMNEYAAGAKVGFDFGLEQGARVALSPALDYSAPREFKFEKPEFSAMVSQAFGKLNDVSRKVQEEEESNEKVEHATFSPGGTSGPSSGDTGEPKTLPTPWGHNESHNESSSRSALIGENSPATLTSSESSMEHWEKDLVTPLTVLDIEHFHAARNHTRVFGFMKGKYTVWREIKKGMQSVKNSNKTYNLEVQAIGFMMNNIAYLSLEGTIENANVLHGSLIARHLINIK